MSISELLNLGQDANPSPFIPSSEFVGQVNGKPVNSVVIGRVLREIELIEEEGQYGFMATYDTYVPGGNPSTSLLADSKSQIGITGSETVITTRAPLGHAMRLQFSQIKLHPETAHFLRGFMGDSLETPNPHTDPPVHQFPPLRLLESQEISLDAA